MHFYHHSTLTLIVLSIIVLSLQILVGLSINEKEVLRFAEYASAFEFNTKGSGKYGVQLDSDALTKNIALHKKEIIETYWRR